MPLTGSTVVQSGSADVGFPGGHSGRWTMLGGTPVGLVVEDDLDGYLSTDEVSVTGGPVGSLTIPAGSGLIIPAGLAGRYLASAIFDGTLYSEVLVVTYALVGGGYADGLIIARGTNSSNATGQTGPLDVAALVIVTGGPTGTFNLSYRGT